MNYTSASFAIWYNIHCISSLLLCNTTKFYVTELIILLLALFNPGTQLLVQNQRLKHQKTA